MRGSVVIAGLVAALLMGIIVFILQRKAIINITAKSIKIELACGLRYRARSLPAYRLGIFSNLIRRTRSAHILKGYSYLKSLVSKLADLLR